MEDKQFQEIHCHGCDQYVRFPIDLSLDGNHVLTCPKCGHEHCRVVKDGIITGDRWSSRNGITINVASTYVTTSSTAFVTNVYSTGSTSSYFLQDAWANTTA